MNVSLQNRIERGVEAQEVLATIGITSTVKIIRASATDPGEVRVNLSTPWDPDESELEAAWESMKDYDLGFSPDKDEPLQVLYGGGSNGWNIAGFKVI